jgi:long-chain acyl-CoA synthetase
MTLDTIPGRLINAGRTRADLPAYHTRVDGTWVATSWAGYADQTRAVGEALIALGLEAGQKVCILGFNRPEWIQMDIAAMAVGGVPAGIYTTCAPPEVAYIMQHTAAPIVLVEDHAQWEKVRSERDADHLPDLRHIILMAGAAAIDDPMTLTWAQFVEHAGAADPAAFDARLNALETNDLATLIYTSGTTGPPKGVMLSHDNLAWTTDQAVTIVDAGPADCLVSYLPLSHIAEQMLSLYVPITTGMSIYFAESIATVKDAFIEVQPTVLFAVPRIWEKFYAGVKTKLDAAPPLQKRIANWAMGVGRTVNARRNVGRGEPTGLLSLKYALAKRLVFARAKPNLGLSRARACISGAAPISADIIEYFTGLDVQILEVYGQSEGSGPTSFNVPGQARIGSVGPAFPGVEVRIAGDDEILVRGRNVFLGYYREPEATAETLVDGWLHSGDLGRIDPEGFVHITGRKKDIIITAGGKNIAPKNIEASIKDLPIVGQAVVIGDRRKFLSALIALDPDVAPVWARAHDAPTDIAALAQDPTLRAEIEAHIDAINQDLARVEQIKTFTVLHRPLEIGQELTPTMKVQRSKVNHNFAEVIEAMYPDQTPS